jgi:hypothetical protein
VHPTTIAQANVATTAAITSVAAVTGQTYYNENILANCSGGNILAKGGYSLRDKTGYIYSGLWDNGSNLWIGATALKSTHHTGSTYISTGYNGTSGNSTIQIAVPNSANNDAAYYSALHAGNYSSLCTSFSNKVTFSSGVSISSGATISGGITATGTFLFKNGL